MGIAMHGSALLKAHVIVAQGGLLLSEIRRQYRCVATYKMHT